MIMSRLDEKTCPFCSIDPSFIITGNNLVFAIRDAYPVTPLHTLVLPRRHVPYCGNFTTTLLKRIARSKDSMWASTSALWLVRQSVIAMFT
jgi:HIT domain